MIEYGTVNPFYQSEKWKRKRRYVLARDGHTDQIEKRYGRMKTAQTVHHIFPLEKFPEYAWNSWNLISVSYATHNKLHNRNRDTLTREGLDLLRRTAKKRNIIVTKEMIDMLV